MPKSRPDIAVFLYEPGNGGLDRVAILLANGFAARGLRTELWLTRDEGVNRPLIDPALTIRMIPAPATGRGIALALQVPALRAIVRSVRPRILLSAGNQSNLTVALACRGTDTAAIAKMTNPMVRPGQTGVRADLRRTRFRMTARANAQTLVLGTAKEQQLHTQWPDIADRISFAPLPIVTPDMLDAAQQPRPAGTSQFIAVGRLMPQKDHATLFSALALLQSADWHLRIVGDGPLQDALMAQATALGITDRISFMGFVDDPTPLFAQSHLLLLSSRWEGLGAVVIEALASGCGVVSTDSTPNLHCLLKAAGQLAPVSIGDPQALAGAIDAAVQRPLDQTAMAAATALYRLDEAIDAHVALFEPWLTGRGKSSA